jgi:hypothetical protein
MQIHAGPGLGGISHSHNIFTVKMEKKVKTKGCGSAEVVPIRTVWKKLASAVPRQVKAHLSCCGYRFRLVMEGQI